MRDEVLHHSCRMGTMARPVESHNEAQENILAGPPKHYRGPLQREKFEFFCAKWCILVYFIFLSDGVAPQTSRDPGWLYPFTPPSRRALPWPTTHLLARDPQIQAACLTLSASVRPLSAYTPYQLSL